MTALLIIHFGAPRDRAEIAPFLDDIFSDHYGIFAKPIALLARHSALKKYEAVGFVAEGESRLLDSVSLRSRFSTRYARSKDNNNYCSSECEQSEHESRTPIFFAAQYGKPSIEEALSKIDEEGIEKITVLPLYPHATVEMYDSIFKKIDRLKHRFFRNMQFRWSGPFFDHPLFIDAWADSIKNSMEQLENKDFAHIIFCAHAIPITVAPFTLSLSKGKKAFISASTSSARTEYEFQVEYSANAIMNSTGLKNSSSIAYQSAMRIGRWSRPSINGEIRRLASCGVSSCLIVPISFLFDNVETLFDIDRVVIPAAKIAGMKDIRRATPPGDSDKIVEMLTTLPFVLQRILQSKFSV